MASFGRLMRGLQRALGRFAILRPLAVRDFRYLWAGMTVSLLGDGIFLVAVAWQVFELSNAPTALAIVGVATTAPQVLLLLAGGVISDRLDRRKVMVAADLVRAVAIGAIGALALTGSLTMALLIGLVAVFGCATAFFGPSFDAIVPEVVPARLLVEANALDQFVRPGALRLAGPALGGVAVATVGAGTAFIADAATFAASAAAVLRMGPPLRAPAGGGSEASSSPFQEIREGFSFVRSRVWLWGTFLSATCAYLLFMGPAEVLVPYLVKNEISGGAEVLGLVFAMGGVGAIGAAVIVGQRGTPKRCMTFIYVTWALATLAVAGYGLGVMPWQLMLASLLFHALETAGTIIWATTKQRHIPGPLLGRVSSFDWFISIGLVPLSYAIVGPIAQAVGARATLVGAGVLGATVTISFLFLPGMRDLDRAPAPVASPVTGSASP